jgi:hypothetical protein
MLFGREFLARIIANYKEEKRKKGFGINASDFMFYASFYQPICFQPYAR